MNTEDSKCTAVHLKENKKLLESSKTIYDSLGQTLDLQSTNHLHRIETELYSYSYVKRYGSFVNCSTTETNIHLAVALLITRVKISGVPLQNVQNYGTD